MSLHSFLITYPSTDDARTVLGLLLTKYQDDLKSLTRDGRCSIGLRGSSLVISVPEPEETVEIPSWMTAWNTVGEIVRELDSTLERDVDGEIFASGIIRIGGDIA